MCVCACVRVCVCACVRVSVFFALFVIYFVGGLWGGGGVTEEERRKRRIHLLKWLLFLTVLLGMILGFATDHFVSVFM